MHYYCMFTQASMKSNDSTNLQNEKNNLSDSGLPTTYTNEQYNNKSIENKTNHNGYPIQQQPSSTSVWTYLLFMVLGLLMFHICSSYSDTVCLDMLGKFFPLRYIICEYTIEADCHT